MAYYTISITSEEAAKRLENHYSELIDTLDNLSFPWCSEHFNVTVLVPESSRGALGMDGLDVMCDNEGGYFGFSII